MEPPHEGDKDLRRALPARDDRDAQAGDPVARDAMAADRGTAASYPPPPGVRPKWPMTSGLVRANEGRDEGA